jgi:hypothetical protein
VGSLYLILQKLGLKLNKFSARDLLLHKEAAALHREHRSPDSIARHFNAQGFASPSGKSWTPSLVYSLLVRIGERSESWGKLHRRVFTEAQGRGLSYREMALEFNERNISRRGNQPWTTRNVAERASKLHLVKRDRVQKELTSTEPLEPVVVLRE